MPVRIARGFHLTGSARNRPGPKRATRCRTLCVWDWSDSDSVSVSLFCLPSLRIIVPAVCPHNTLYLSVSLFMTAGFGGLFFSHPDIARWHQAGRHAVRPVRSRAQLPTPSPGRDPSRRRAARPSAGAAVRQPHDRLHALDDGHPERQRPSRGRSRAAPHTTAHSHTAHRLRRTRRRAARAGFSSRWTAPRGRCRPPTAWPQPRFGLTRAPPVNGIPDAARPIEYPACRAVPAPRQIGMSIDTLLLLCHTRNTSLARPPHGHWPSRASKW